MRNRSETGEPCRVLEWDSQFFGFRIGTVMRHALDAAGMEQVLAWCAAQRIQCLYFLSEASDATSLRLAHERGFRFVDVRVSYRMPVELARPEPPPLPSALVRAAEARDVPALRELAARSHVLSRFWTDEGFGRDACAELYSRWIERSCQGYADSVWVAESEGLAAGYVTCHLRDGGLGEFGLVGVDAKRKGQGLGRALVERGLAWLRDEGCREIGVVTQGSNVAAHRLYQSLGFKTAQVQYWHHLWLRRGQEARA